MQIALQREFSGALTSLRQLLVNFELTTATGRSLQGDSPNHSIILKTPQRHPHPPNKTNTQAASSDLNVIPKNVSRAFISTHHQGSAD